MRFSCSVLFVGCYSFFVMRGVSLVLCDLPCVLSPWFFVIQSLLVALCCDVCVVLVYVVR